MKGLFLISNIRIQNANALSSPYTIGFPAMTAWLGAVHKLQRELRNKGFPNILFLKTGVICHDFRLETYKEDFSHCIIGTRNPNNEKGKPPSFIEEPRCHLTVSLIIEYDGLHDDEENNNSKFIRKTTEILHSKMKIAGGDILQFSTPNKDSFIQFNKENDANFIIHELLPKLKSGQILIERRDLLEKTMREENKDALESLLDYLKVTSIASKGEQGDVHWKKNRKTTGWIVPIAVGFQGVSALGTAKKQRDVLTAHRFAESVITLGEFVMPYRIRDKNEMLWEYHIDHEKNLYLCRTCK